MPRHPTIKDNRSPAKSRPRRRYFGAPLPSTSRGEGAALAARRRAEATSTGASTAQNLHHPRRDQPYDRRLRGRAASASLRARPHRLLVCLQFLVYRCVCAAAPAAPRSLAELRSGCLRCRGPRWPLSEFIGLQRRQQRRYAERSNARDPPTEPARRRMSVLSSLPSGDPFVPCWCWQARETPLSHAA